MWTVYNRVIFVFRVYNQFTSQFMFIFHHPHRIIHFTKCIIIKFNFVNFLSISDTHSHIVITDTVKHWLQVSISCVFISFSCLSNTFTLHFFPSRYFPLLPFTFRSFSNPLLFPSRYSISHSVFQISIINFNIAILVFNLSTNHFHIISITTPLSNHWALFLNQ